MPKETILVVDDEEDILELIQFNLAREGYQITGATSGEEALKKAGLTSFDLIVLDLMQIIGYKASALINNPLGSGTSQ
jgi:CheY-like chemotaxis protein